MMLEWRKLNNLRVLLVLVASLLVSSCASFQPKASSLIGDGRSISVVSLYPDKGKYFKVATVFNSEERSFDINQELSVNLSLERMLIEKLLDKGYSVKSIDTDAVRAASGRTVRGIGMFDAYFDSKGNLERELKNQAKTHSIDYFLLFAPDLTDYCYSTTVEADTYGIIHRTFGFGLNMRASLFASTYMAMVKPEAFGKNLKSSYADLCVKIENSWSSLENLNNTEADPKFSEAMYNVVEEVHEKAFDKMDF